MRDGWVEATLGDVAEFCRDRIDPLALNPDEILRHWSIPVLDETGGPRDESAREIGSHKFRVQKNAVVFSLLNPRIPRFALVVGGDNVVCSTEFAVMQPGPKMHENFLFVLASSDVFHQRVNSLANGTTKSRERVKSSDLENVSILLPPIVEQKRIVDLVSSVDVYIDSLQQQVDSARAARNSVLHELLSAGGDDWIETTLGEVATCAGGTAFPHDYQGGITGTPFVKVSDMNEPGNELFMIRSNNYVLDATIRSLGARLWPAGTIVFAKVGAALLTEKRRILIRDTIFDNNIMGLVPKALVDSHFLYLFMQTVKLGEFVQPGAVPSVNNSIVSRIEINLPPLVEQKRIVEIVSSMDDVVVAGEQAVADARNLRSGLLSDLLSGEHEIPKSYDQLMGDK